MISNVFDYSEFESSSEISKLLDAARHGDATAQFKLGVRYASGDGVRKCVGEAVKWMRKAAENGHAEAQHKLGQWYNLGIGVTKNPSEAFNWWLKSAAQGYAPAQYNLGVCYEAGWGVKKNMKKAVELYGRPLLRGKIGRCRRWKVSANRNNRSDANNANTTTEIAPSAGMNPAGGKLYLNMH